MSAPTLLTVMSFNIRYRNAIDGEHRWARRKDLVVQRIRAAGPDLLGLQECRDDSQARVLRAHLPEYAFLGVQRGGAKQPGDDWAMEMAPLLYKKSVFEEVESGFFWLSETPNLPGSSSWGSHFPRTVAWARLEVKAAPGRVLAFFNTHFDTCACPALDESARLLRQRFETLGPGMPILLTGDFNTQKDSPPYRALLGVPGAPAALYDTYRRAFPAQDRSEGTFHGFGTIDPPWSIDWLLASEHFQAQEAGIDRYSQNGLYPSDHYPVYARLSLS